MSDAGPPYQLRGKSVNLGDAKYEYEERLRTAEDADLQYQVDVLQKEIERLRSENRRLGILMERVRDVTKTYDAYR